jgi:hypothetical protein
MDRDELRANLPPDERAELDALVATFPETKIAGPTLPLSERDKATIKRAKSEVADEGPESPSVIEQADEALRIESDRSSTWRAVDIREHLAEDDAADAPNLLPRTDGLCLVYERKRNEFHGPYESGKSWLAKVVALEAIRRGGVVVWLDFEDSPRSVVSRLLALGAEAEAIVALLRYIQPGEPLTTEAEIDLRLELAGSTLVVIDAANEAMAAAGLDPNLNRDIALWYAKVPRLATDAGATLLVLDHVAKHAEQQRGAVGGAHKIAAVDGASYRIDAMTPFGRGSAGLVRLQLEKDRGGHIRGALGSGQRPVAAEVHFDATDPARIVVEVRPPSATRGSDEWRPTHLMSAVSRFLEARDQPASQRDIEASVPGRRQYVAEALEQLVSASFVERTSGPRGASLHVSIRPFREEES